MVASGGNCPNASAPGTPATPDRWSRNGVLDRVFAALQEEQIVAGEIGVGGAGQY